MLNTLHIETTVLPGHRLEISTPDLPEGATVQVTVVMPGAARTSMLQLVQNLPQGPHSFPTWEEYEQHLQEEKDSWDR